jgi:hypothetical protein
MSLKAWLLGLLSGVIASAANAGSAALGAMVLAPELLHEAHFWKVITATAAFAGIKTALAWLAKSPLPNVLTTETVTTVKTTSTDPPPAVPESPKP